MRLAIVAASLAALAFPGSALASDDPYGLAERPARDDIAGDEQTFLRTGPQASGDTAPPDPSSARVARFTYDSEAGTAFECRLDGEPWRACGAGTEEVSGLGEGAHVFAVRSLDADGTPDATPAEFRWRVDLTPPETTVDAEPYTQRGSPPWVWNFHTRSSEPHSRTWLSMDAGRFWPAGVHIHHDRSFGIDTTYGLVGKHRWGFAAIDAAGNVDPTPEWVDFELHEYPDWLPAPGDDTGQPAIGPYPGAPPVFKMAVRSVRGNAVKVDVTAPVRGRLAIRLGDRRIASRRVRAGKQRLRLKLGRQGRRQLRKGGRLVGTLSAGKRVRLTTRAKR